MVQKPFWCQHPSSLSVSPKYECYGTPITYTWPFHTVSVNVSSHVYILFPRHTLSDCHVHLSARVMRCLNVPIVVSGSWNAWSSSTRLLKASLELTLSNPQSLVKIANSKHLVWYQRFMQRSEIEESLCLVSVSQLYWDWVYPLNFAKLLMASISSSFDIKI